jgi:hypothetical protein
MEMQLEFIPTADLIDELCRRSTFAGVIIFQKDEIRNVRPADISCNKIRWNVSNMTASKALVQMSNASKYLTDALKREEQNG